MPMLDNQTIATYDVADALRNEEGVFLVQRGGQSFIVEAERGHSIKSWTPVGQIETVSQALGSNPPFSVTRISTALLSQYKNQQLNEATARR